MDGTAQDSQGPPPGAVATPIVATSIPGAAAAPSGPPPGAVATPIAGAAQPAAAPHGAAFAPNPSNEGTYQMTSTKDGTPVQVPYSQVPVAMKQGYGMDFNGDGQRYMKDRAADPNTSTMGDAAHAVVSVPGDVAHGLKLWLPSPADLAKGAVKKAAEIPQSIASWFGGDQAKEGMRQLENRLLPGSGNPASNASQERGGNMEQVGEFGAGDAVLSKLTEALLPMAEGADYAQKLKNTAPIIKIAAAHPRIARVLAAGIRQGALGGGITVLHGGSAGDTAKAAVIQGLLGTAFEGIPEGISALRESAAAATAATAAHEAAPAVEAERVAAMKDARQAQAQGQIKDVARQSAEDALNRLNATRQPTTVRTPIGNRPAPIPAREGADTIDEGLRAEAQRAKLGSAADAIPGSVLPKNPIVQELGSRAGIVPGRIWDEIGNPAQDIGIDSTVAPHFDPVDATAEAADTSSFGHAAEKIRTAAQPVYQAIDQATGGQFTKLQAARAAAFRSGDSAAIDKADDAIDEMLQRKPDKVDASDYAAAKSAWRDSKVLDKLHNTVEGAFNGISEERAAQPGVGGRQLLGGNEYGGTLSTRMGRLMQKPGMPAAIERVIGKEGIANLDRAGNLVSKPELRKATMDIAEEVAKQFPKPAEPNATAEAVKRFGARVTGGGIGEVVGHVLGVPPAISGPVGAAVPDVTRMVMRKVVTSPRIGELMDYAVRNKVTPRLAGGLIAAEIQREQNQTNGGTQ
jgi:hypothetical protein